MDAASDLQTRGHVISPLCKSRFSNFLTYAIPTREISQLAYPHIIPLNAQSCNLGQAVGHDDRIDSTPCKEGNEDCLLKVPSWNSHYIRRQRSNAVRWRRRSGELGSGYRFGRYFWRFQVKGPLPDFSVSLDLCTLPFGQSLKQGFRSLLGGKAPQIVILSVSHDVEIICNLKKNERSYLSISPLA